MFGLLGVPYVPEQVIVNRLSLCVGILNHRRPIGGILISTTMLYPIGQDRNKNIVCTRLNFQLLTKRSIYTYEGSTKICHYKKELKVSSSIKC